VDAAILFADILLPAIPLGVGLEFAKGEGPVLQNPVRTMEDVRALKPVDAETDLGYVMEAIRILRRELTDTPLIGFCGAPFTVASYIIEGGSSREFLKTKTMMYSAPDVFHALMDKLADVFSDYLTAQIRAGAQAVQVFDSWVGALSPSDYETFVLPYSQKLLKAAQAMNVPVIHFGTNTTTLLPLMKRAGGDVIGLDWRIPLDDGWSLLGDDVAVQGNLDPITLFAPLPELKARVHDVCAAQMANLVTSSIWVMAFCNTHPLIVSKRSWTWCMSFLLKRQARNDRRLCHGIWRTEQSG
jgi:uroporphyrinogen decarboxylase